MRIEHDMVQVARSNGTNPVKAGNPKRRTFTLKHYRRWVRYAKSHSIEKTAEKFGVVPSMIYGAKNRMAKKSNKLKRGNKLTASYKAAGAARRGAAIGDAVTYVRHARTRAAALGEAGYTVLGLLSLALEALGAPD